MRVSLSADRISGLVFLLAGLAMIFGVIPAEVEAVEGGNIAPSTLPIVMSAIMAFGEGCCWYGHTRHQNRPQNRQQGRPGQTLTHGICHPGASCFGGSVLCCCWR